MEIANVMLYIISVLLSIIAFFLVKFFSSVSKIIETVNRIDTEQQLQKLKIDNLEKKISDIDEMLKRGFYP